MSISNFSNSLSDLNQNKSRKFVFNQTDYQQNVIIKQRADQEISKKVLKDNDQNLNKFKTQRFQTTYNQKFSQSKNQYEQNNRFFFKKEQFTKFNVSYVPKNYERIKYKIIEAEKAKQIYNCSQPVSIKSPQILHYIDQTYFKENQINKNIIQTSQSEKKHFKFKLPKSSFSIKNLQQGKYVFK